MSHNFETWRDRIRKREDLTVMLTHLTKPRELLTTTDENDVNALATENLINLLKDGVLKGSTTSSGFIVGDRPAVCFYEAPLLAIAQNVRHEIDSYLENRGNRKLRYCGAGLMFHKCHIFKLGGRPVIYDRTETAKQYLTADLHWRIVNYNPGLDCPIDWTHEREWRVPGDFDFSSEQFAVLLPDATTFKSFIRNCPPEVLGRVSAINDLSFMLG